MARMMEGSGRELDDAQSARQPQAGDPDEKMFATMVAGLREHIFGRGEQGIVDQMTKADDPGRVMGELTYSLVREAANQAAQSGEPASMDVLIGVATEVIDDISELMGAHGMELDDKQREFALLYAQQLYVESSDVSDEDREAAKQQLGQMKESGDVDNAVKYVQQRGAEAGADPFGVEQQQRPQMMGGEE